MPQLVSPNEDFHRYERRVETLAEDNLWEVVVRCGLPELVLTQDVFVGDDRAILPIDPRKDLTVYGDVVVIRGPLLMYGRAVTIVARQLVGEEDASEQGPAIVVDGMDAEATVRALAKPPRPGLPDNAPRAKDATITWTYGGDATTDPAADGKAGVAGDDGQPGASGGPAGRISIWAESLTSPNTRFRFSARGGDGAPGEPGQDGGDGQGGGNGAFQLITRPSGPGGRPSPVPYVAAGGRGGAGGSGGWGGPGGVGGNGGRIEIGVTRSDQSLGARVVGQTGLRESEDRGFDAIRGVVRLAAGPNVAPGRSGLRGQDGSPGQSGAGGVNYDQQGKQILATGSPGPAANPEPRRPAPAPARPGTVRVSTTLGYQDLMPHSDPAQLDMTLQQAKTAFLIEDLARCDALLLYLVSRLAQFRPLPHQKPPEVPGLAPGDVDWLNRVEQEASTLQIWRQQGLNAFGYRPNYVPLVEYTSYLDSLSKLAARYQTVEKAYTEYVAKYQDAEAAQTGLRIAIGQSAELQSIRASEQSDLIKDLKDLNGLLESDEARVTTAGASLQTAISGLEESIKGYFNCDVQAVVTALGLMAFVPPVHQVQGPAGAGTAATGAEEAASATGWAFSPLGGVMAAAQAVEIYDSMANYVTTADGVQVSKANLIAEVREVGGDLDSLREGYNWARDRAGQLQLNLDDPGGIKLIASLSALQKQLDSLPSDLQTKDVRQAIQQYVDAVQARNQDILRYNAMLAVLGRLQAEQRATDQRINELRSKVDGAADPMLPELTTFLGRTYQDLRNAALRCLYLVTRAYVCWSLEPLDLWKLGFSSRAHVTADELNSALGKIDTDVKRVTESYYGAYASGASPVVGSDGMGVVVTIDDADALDRFRRDNRLLFQIPPPVYHLDDGGQPSPSPFSDWSNVRLRRACPWVVGARTTNRNNELKVNLTQLGNLGDTFLTPDDTPITFVHSAVHAAPFSFQADKAPSPDMDRKTYAALVKLDTGIIIGAGDLPRPANGGGVKFAADSPGYTGIGPFATWEIVVNPEVNPGLDLSGVSSVWIDFWISGQSRNDR